VSRAARASLAVVLVLLLGTTAYVALGRVNDSDDGDDEPRASGAAPTTPRSRPTARPRQGRPVAVKVLQYNIQFGDAGLAGVADDIRASGADVVLLNEVDDRTATGGVRQADRLGSLLEMDVAYDPNGAVRTGVRGNAVLSRFRIADVRRWDLPRPDGTEQRGLMRVRLTSRTLSFHVWTTHLNPDVGTRRQARRVRTIVGVPYCTTILGGDLNVRPHRDPPALLREHLTDVWRAQGNGAGGTNRAGTRRIDYLYQGLARGTSIQVRPRGSSDHRPLLATLVLDPRRSC
jgi:endonuclease/exonuclease/phosphatase family metal-dependent hydrolase